MPTTVTCTEDEKVKGPALIAMLTEIIHQADPAGRAGFDRRFTDGVIELTFVAQRLTQIIYTQTAYKPF